MFLLITAIVAELAVAILCAYLFISGIVWYGVLGFGMIFTVGIFILIHLVWNLIYGSPDFEYQQKASSEFVD